MRALLLLLPFLIFFLFNTPSVYAATYTVTKTADTNDGTCDADCSLREAVASANDNAGADTIEFDIPTSDDGYDADDDYFAITLSSLLDITDDSGVFINGYSQPGATRNTASFGETINAKLMIQIQTGATNIRLNSDNNHITGLNIWRGSGALVVLQFSNASNNRLEGNFFGSDITGSFAEGSGNVQVNGSSSNNFIGTNGDGSGDEGERNLFLSNEDFATTGASEGLLYFQGGQSNNVIAGNYMGVNKTGRVCQEENFYRFAMTSFSGGKQNFRLGTNLDGISDSEESNIIGCVSLNTRAATGAAPEAIVNFLSWTNSVIQGNYIGVSPYGDALQPNFPRAAVKFLSTNSQNVTVRDNNIAHVDAQGIYVNNTSSGLTFSRNKIHSTTLLSIDIGSTGVTVNDAGDEDTGANDLMNFPVLKKATREGDTLKVVADLDFNPTEAPFTIELFDNDEVNSSGHGGGHYFIGSVTTSTIGENVTLTVPITGQMPTSAARLTSTATNSNGSTSEFSTTPEDITLYISQGTSTHRLSKAKPPSCNDAKPAKTPQLFQINTKSNSATLYFAPSGNNTSKYFIAYGHTPGEELYGVEYNESSQDSALSYTINALQPNTTYYFKIRGGNGCMPGDWSNSMQATTTISESSLERIFTAWEQMREVVLSWMN